MESHSKTMPMQQVIAAATIAMFVPPKEAAIFVVPSRSACKKRILRIASLVDLYLAKDDDNTQERLLKTKLRGQILSFIQKVS